LRIVDGVTARQETFRLGQTPQTHRGPCMRSPIGKDGWWAEALAHAGAPK
jgi:hypothetical protein